MSKHTAAPFERRVDRIEIREMEPAEHFLGLRKRTVLRDMLSALDSDRGREFILTFKPVADEAEIAMLDGRALDGQLIEDALAFADAAFLFVGGNLFASQLET